MPELRDAYAQIDRFAERWMTLHNVPGLSMSITDRNETLRILHRGFANMERREPIAPGTIFEAGSIGKSFTALCLLQLAEAGSLDLHRPASDYLPWFEVGGSHGTITVHHLLTHTAGITRGGDYAPYGQYEVWALRNTVTGGPPGTRFNYSNAGYKALGHLLEAVAGAGYADIIRSQVLGPLGMADTHPVTTLDTRDLMAQGYWPQYDDRPEPPGNPVVPAGWHEYGSGDGSIASTAADMAAYVRLFLNGASPVISTKSFDLMIGKHIPVGYIPDTWYGYGLNVSDRHGFKQIDHGGLMLGHHATLMADLDNGIGVTVLTNGTLEPTAVADFTLRALRGARGIGQLPDPHAELPEPGRVPNAADYVGTFTGKGGSFRVVAQDAKLALEFDDESAPLERRGRDRFHADHPDLSPAPADIRTERWKSGRGVPRPKLVRQRPLRGPCRVRHAGRVERIRGPLQVPQPLVHELPRLRAQGPADTRSARHARLPSGYQWMTAHSALAQTPSPPSASASER